MQAVNLMKSINRMTLIDGEDTYERKQVSFAQLPEIIKTFLEICSAAAVVYNYTTQY